LIYASALREAEVIRDAVVIDPANAFLDHLLSQYGDIGIQELVRSGLLLTHATSASPTGPPERRAALTALAERLDQEIKQIGT
jgi:hypothetical protein